MKRALILIGLLGCDIPQLEATVATGDETVVSVDAAFTVAERDTLSTCLSDWREWTHGKVAMRIGDDGDVQLHRSAPPRGGVAYLSFAQRSAWLDADHAKDLRATCLSLVATGTGWARHDGVGVLGPKVTVDHFTEADLAVCRSEDGGC